MTNGCSTNVLKARCPVGLVTQEADGDQDQVLNEGTTESGGQLSPQVPPFTAGHYCPSPHSKQVQGQSRRWGKRLGSDEEFCRGLKLCIKMSSYGKQAGQCGKCAGHKVTETTLSLVSHIWH